MDTVLKTWYLSSDKCLAEYHRFQHQTRIMYSSLLLFCFCVLPMFRARTLVFILPLLIVGLWIKRQKKDIAMLLNGEYSCSKNGVTIVCGDKNNSILFDIPYYLSSIHISLWYRMRVRFYIIGQVPIDRELTEYFGGRAALYAALRLGYVILPADEVTDWLYARTKVDAIPECPDYLRVEQ